MYRVSQKMVFSAKNGGVLENSGYCEAQARIGKGWPSRQKASKLKALPRAYIKVHLTLSHLRVTTGYLFYKQT